MSDLGEEFAKICIQWLKKTLVYMRFDCIPPEFSPFRNFKKNIGKLNSLTVRQKKNRPTDPIFKFCACEGNITIFFGGPYCIFSGGQFRDSSESLPQISSAWREFTKIWWIGAAVLMPLLHVQTSRNCPERPEEAIRTSHETVLHWKYRRSSWPDLASKYHINSLELLFNWRKKPKTHSGTQKDSI